MHLNDEQVAALVHDNLASPATMVRAITHEASCRFCTERVELEQTLDAFAGQTLRVIDHARPNIDVRDIIRRARVRAARRAVLALILVAAGATAASAAIPGTPVNTFLKHAREGAAPVQTTRPISAAAPRAVSNAISIIPNGTLDVVLPEISRGSVHIKLVDSGTATFSSSDPNVAYTLEETRIVVRSISTVADYEVSLPASLRSVRITAAGRTVYARENGLAHCTGTLVDTVCTMDFGVIQR